MRRRFRLSARLLDSRAPEHQILHYNLGVSLTALRRLEEAAEAFHSAAHLSPSNGEAWGNLGAAMAELGRWKDAAPCQERAVRLAPSVTHALNLASTLYELNRLTEAERVLRDAVALDSRSVDARESLATVLAGQDRYDEAIRIARELCESNSGALSSQTVLAGVLSEAGYLDEALQVAKAAADTAPHNARVYGALGSVYLKMNDGESALAAFERMAECLAPERDRLPSSPWVSYATGRGVAFAPTRRRHGSFRGVRQSSVERWPGAASGRIRSTHQSSCAAFARGCAAAHSRGQPS